MRITGGEFSGHRLRVARGKVRPTTDRAREALFSILGSRVLGARVLDLFAGSGAVGLEAVSRGAAAVTWVEGDRRVARLLRDNALRIGVNAPRIFQRDVPRFLEHEARGAAFDVVFADPPYRWGAWDRDRTVPRAVREAGGILPLLARKIHAAGCLAPEGLFILERDAGHAVGTVPHWRCVDQRTYGGTTFLFFSEEVPE